MTTRNPRRTSSPSYLLSTTAFLLPSVLLIALLCNIGADTSEVASGLSPRGAGNQCQVDRRQGMTVGDIRQPSMTLSDKRDAHTPDACVEACCHAISAGCNAVAFYAGSRRTTCLLLHCDIQHGGCSWKKSSEHSVVARVRPPREVSQHPPGSTTQEKKSMMDRLWQYYQEQINPQINGTIAPPTSNKTDAHSTNLKLNLTAPETTTTIAEATTPNPKTTVTSTTTHAPTTTVAHPAGPQIPPPDLNRDHARHRDHGGRDRWRAHPKEQPQGINHGGHPGAHEAAAKPNAQPGPALTADDLDRLFGEDDAEEDVFEWDDHNAGAESRINIKDRKDGKKHNEASNSNVSMTATAPTTATTTTSSTTQPPKTTATTTAARLSHQSPVGGDGQHHVHQSHPVHHNGRGGHHPAQAHVMVAGGAGAHARGGHRASPPIAPPLSTPFLIGICACLAIGVLVLLAIFWKVAVTDDNGEGLGARIVRRSDQRYTPLRDDYDVNNESPNLTQTLLGSGRKL